jgi:CHASE2 domain
MAVIDERSLDAEGRWPWPRPKIAALFDALSRGGARVIPFDVAFAEPAAPEDDLALAAAIPEFAGARRPLLCTTHCSYIHSCGFQGSTGRHQPREVGGT